MKRRFRLYRRKRGGRFYLHDGLTGKQESLVTCDRKEASRLLHAKNEAQEHKALDRFVSSINRLGLFMGRRYHSAQPPTIRDVD
jgi:hypothetical protein